MLVRSGMKDDFRALILQDFVQGFPIEDIHKERLDAIRAKHLGDLKVHIKQAILGFVQQKQLSRTASCNLPAKFRPDTAAGPGDKNHSVADDLSRFFHIYVNFVTLQQVFDARIAQIPP
jgi:hypothetical protein